MEWHHLVEQCQARPWRSGFNIGDINTTANVRATPKDVHKEISRYYSSKHEFTDNKTFRDWLTGKSFDEQLQYGIQVWKDKMLEAGYDV